MSGESHETRGVDPTAVIWKQLDALAKTIERNHAEVIDRQRAIHDDVVGLADKVERELAEIRTELASVDTKVEGIDGKVETLRRAEQSLASEVAALKSWTTDHEKRHHASAERERQDTLVGRQVRLLPSFILALIVIPVVGGAACAGILFLLVRFVGLGR